MGASEEPGGNSGPSHGRAGPERGKRPELAEVPKAPTAAAQGRPYEPANPTAIPWTRRKQRGAFAGDVAAAQLRTRLTQAPDRLARRTSPASSERGPSTIARAVGIATVLIIGGGSGYMWSQISHRPVLPQESSVSASSQSSPGPASTLGPGLQQGGTASRQGAVQPPPDATGLAPRDADASRELTPGAASGPDRPSVAAVNRPPRQVDAAEIAAMMRRGELLLANADIAGARLVFQRAAESGDAAAAFALAETYDPTVLGKTGMKGGITGDVPMARMWYERARALGSTAAAERIARLGG
jgi:hypothetical protein